MTSGERVKLVRKELRLTLDKFGERIGLKKSSLSQVENNINSLSDQACKSICREFNVNEEWLRYGTGEMFEEMLPEDEYAAAAAEVAKDDPMMQQFLITYIKQSEAGREAIRKFVMDLVEQYKNQ